MTTAADITTGARITIPSQPFGSVLRIDPCFVEFAELVEETHYGRPAMRIRYRHPGATFTDIVPLDTPVTIY